MKITRSEIKKQLWIWGAGSLGVLFSDLVLRDGGRIAGFIDNSIMVQNTVINGIQVYSPNAFLNEYDNEKLIVCCCAPKNNIKIRQQLGSMGIHENNIRDIDISCFEGFQNKPANFMEDAYEERMISKICNAEDFEQDYFKRISKALNWNIQRLHRKIWEFVFITRVLEDKGLLKVGYSGVGFAVGQEPLPSYFASCGVDILATDLGSEGETAKLWACSNQNALGDVYKLWHEAVVSKSEFDKHVKYRDVDMNFIPEDIGTFDFCWSSCAIEHVGGLDKSKQFLKNMIKVLKPGGIAVHTTEFNIWSNEETEENGYSIIYRKKDLEEMSKWFADNGCVMELSFKRKASAENKSIPLPPYDDDDTRNHLNLIVGRYASTSYGIVVTKL